jgi:hypothetical protein
MATNMERRGAIGGEAEPVPCAVLGCIIASRDKWRREMTNEELREELWNLESDMARMREHEPKVRRRFFQMIREMAARHVDEEGRIQ